MAGITLQRLLTLVQRELQEYRVSMLITPLAIAAVLSAIMLVSVVLAGRFAAMSGDLFDVLVSADQGGMPVITINLDDEPLVPEPPLPPEPAVDRVVEFIAEDPNSQDDWNFSREWRFEPGGGDDTVEWEVEEVGSLNPALGVVHGFMLIVLIIVSINYLAGSLFNDRKDRTILFWKSMPVSEWEEVLVRLGMALVVAPAIYIAVALLLQVVMVLLGMLLVVQMDKEPFEAVLGNVEFGALLQQQIGGWLLTALWVAPLYAYIMLASAFAKRSPFLMAVTPVVALVILEYLVFGTDYVSTAVFNHLPHYIGGESAVGFYFDVGFWSQVDFLSLLLGLLFAAAAVTTAVYLRRYRFEI